MQIDKVSGEIIYEYPSVRDAARLNFTSNSTLVLAIKENRPAIGFIWKYEDQVADELLYVD